MGRKTLHNQGLEAMVKHVALHDALVPPHELDIADACAQLQADIAMFHKIQNIRYLNPLTHTPKDGSLFLTWEYAQNEDHHHLFIQMLCVYPLVFAVIHHLIKDHPVFCNNSNVPQSPVNFQLAVTLYRLGQFGNATSLIDLAHEAGCSTGSVEEFTERCYMAIESLHQIFVCQRTSEEKKREEW